MRTAIQIALAVGAVAATSIVCGACFGDVGPAEADLTGKPGVQTVYEPGQGAALMDASLPFPEPLELELPVRRGMPCGDGYCEPDELCCAPTAGCYPADCEDCCFARTRGVEPDPRVTPVAGGPAGPQPPPELLYRVPLRMDPDPDGIAH